MGLLRFPDEASFDALAFLPELTDLSLCTRLPWESLEDMPAPPGLTALRLVRTIDASLEGISKWQLLETLIINSGPTPAEWREISSLPNLTDLVISEFDLAQATPLPNVTHLQLSPIDADTQLHLVPDIFPNLKNLIVHCRNALPDIIDVTPLTQIEGMRISLQYANSVIGLEEFDADAIHRYPRPRATGA
ncbi:hypothetical protein ACIOHH_37610 [Streptomyces microflavus]|uniref:hypothetical protein n=1 Tax=Streptomyces microflavus TaxID=1919 RepID=UPI00382EE6E3